MNDLDHEQIADLAWRTIGESELAEKQRRGNDLTLTMLRRILGPAAGGEPPLFNRSVGAKLLKDQAWDKRLAGLVILREYCRADCQGDCALIDEIAEMSSADRHPQVRGVALHTLGSLLKSSRDPKIGKYLALLVLDASLSLTLRSSAYIGLCDLHGANLPIVHEPSELMRQIDEKMLQWYANRTDQEASHQA